MTNDNNRSSTRLEQTATAFIEFLTGNFDRPDHAPIIVCNSLDISSGGLRVCVDQFIEQGTILQLGLELPDADQPLYFVAEVRWSRALGNNQGYWIGFELLDSDGTDLERWQAIMRDLAGKQEQTF